MFQIYVIWAPNYLEKAVGLDLQEVTVMISTKADTGLVYVIHIPAAEWEQAFCLILGISR